MYGDYIDYYGGDNDYYVDYIDYYGGYYGY